MCDLCDLAGIWVCECGVIVDAREQFCPGCHRDEDGAMWLPDFVARKFVEGRLCGCSGPDFGVWAAFDSDALTAVRGCYRCRSLEIWSGCYGLGDGCDECEAVRRSSR